MLLAALMAGGLSLANRLRATDVPTLAQPATASTTWLERVNEYRAGAGLLPVGENSDWSYEDMLHARYTVKTDILAHSEDPRNTWTTRGGAAAAHESNVMASSATGTSDEYAIDLWMQGPFHAIGIIDPRLAEAGFGSYREEDGDYQMAAALDVIRGIDWERRAPRGYPVLWPSGQRPMPLTSYIGGEYPDPLTSCAGYAAPTGPAIIVQVGDGGFKPDVTASSFTQGGRELDHCVFDETSYQNPDAEAEALGRAVLDGRDAIVLIPREPLLPGATYGVLIEANGHTYRWGFTVADDAVQVDPAVGQSSPPSPPQTR